LPKNAGGKRGDGENLRSVLRTKGYIVAENKEEMNAFVTGRVFGMFAGDHMEPEIDRQEFAPKQPSLKEMTLKAIDILSRYIEIRPRPPGGGDVQGCIPPQP
jgi:alkaline phosphatase